MTQFVFHFLIETIPSEIHRHMPNRETQSNSSLLSHSASSFTGPQEKGFYAKIGPERQHGDAGIHAYVPICIYTHKLFLPDCVPDAKSANY